MDVEDLKKIVMNYHVFLASEAVIKPQTLISEWAATLTSSSSTSSKGGAPAGHGVAQTYVGIGSFIDALWSCYCLVPRVARDHSISPRRYYPGHSDRDSRRHSLTP